MITCINPEKEIHRTDGQVAGCRWCEECSGEIKYNRRMYLKSNDNDEKKTVSNVLKGCRIDILHKTLMDG